MYNMNGNNVDDLILNVEHDEDNVGMYDSVYNHVLPEQESLRLPPEDAEESN